MRSIETRNRRNPLVIPGAIALGIATLAAIAIPVATARPRNLANVATIAASRPSARSQVAAAAMASAAKNVAWKQVAPVSTKPNAPAKPAAKATAPKPAAKPVVDRLVAYRGLGSWVDIWDDRAWNDPAGTVNDMARHGVKTLYIETANTRSPYVLKDPAKMATFVRTAHANGMKVVAWYLADMTNLGFDESRIRYAIGWKTSDGQGFDSFALDIESDKVANIGARNAALTDLSQRIRKTVGKQYALGAIIPSPVGISKDFSSWPNFPYGMIVKNYDVILPMAYYTWHGKGNVAALNDALGNVRIIREKAGPKMPIHMIGGLAEDSTPSETKAFVQATTQSGCIGGGLYSWPGTTKAQWDLLKAIR